MIEPDTKDWTWVLDRPCPDCGYDAAQVDRHRVGAAVRDDATGWSAVLALSGVRDRPSPSTWSPLEYACHVRDVNDVMGRRLALLLDEHEPTFDNWDQDATAIEDHYDRQQPAEVAHQLLAQAERVAARYDRLVGAGEDVWARRGLRSNGSEFTVDTLARYHLHDLVHHAHDVRELAGRATVAAYDASTSAYAETAGTLHHHVRPRLEAFARAVVAGAGVGGGAEILEIGSGGGHDALALEELGLDVRRTDVSDGFVARLRDEGHEADVLDPLVDDVGGPYAGVWANACLLHVTRADLPVVLRRLAEATRTGGVLGLSLKEGDGEYWSTHGSISAPRRFVFWREGPLRAVLTGSGWQVESLTIQSSPRDGQAWLSGQARRS